MTRVKSWLPADSLVTVPKVYHFDAHNNFIVMEDCGTDIVTLKDFLLLGKASSPGLAETIGRSLGEFIASMHEWSKSNPDGILDFFNGNEQARKLSAWVTYGRLIDTLKQTGDHVPPALSDPPLEVEESDLQVISTIADELEKDMMSARNIVSPLCWVF